MAEVDKGEIISDKELKLEFKTHNNTRKEKIIPYDKYRIFSIMDRDGEESVWYKKDSSIGNFYLRIECGCIIYGQRDAHENFGVRRIYWEVSCLALWQQLLTLMNLGQAKKRLPMAPPQFLLDFS